MLTGQDCRGYAAAARTCGHRREPRRSRSDRLCWRAAARFECATTTTASSTTPRTQTEFVRTAAQNGGYGLSTLRPPRTYSVTGEGIRAPDRPIGRAHA